MDIRNGIGMAAVSLSALVFLSACDPKTPVQTSDITTEIDAKIAAHNNDTAAHPGLPLPVGQLVGQIATTQIADNAINGNKIATGAVDTLQIADGSILAAKIGPGQVGAAALAANAVQTAAIADMMVTTTKINDAAVTGTKIAATTITAANIVAGTITATQIANTTITGAKLANNTITATQLGANVVTAGEIANNTITAGQIANATITATQIANATITATQIANATITGAKIVNGTITETQVALASSGSGNMTAFTDFYPFHTDAGFGMNVPVAITFACSSTGNAGQIHVFDGAAEVSGTLMTCDGFLKKITFNADKMKNYSLQYKAAMAAQPVTWQGIALTF